MNSFRFPLLPIPWCVLLVAVAALPAGAAEIDSGAQASAPDEAGAAAATAVERVVVTANRSPTDADHVGQSFTVLTLDQLRQDQEISLADIVARTPGVTLARNGGPGQPTSLFIRGADSGQTLVLIDGVKVNDPSDPNSGYDFANLDVGDIARVEVLRGPQSTLYGSEAIGGVVNIVTAQPTAPFQGDIQAEGGSYGTAYVRAGLGGKADRFDWRLAAWYHSTDSVSAFDKTFGGTGNDPFHTAGASGRLTYALTPGLQLDERAYFTWSRTEFDGFDTPTFTFGNDNEFGRIRQVVDYTGLNASLLDGRLKNRLAFEYSSLNRQYEDPNQPGSKFTFLDTGAATTVEDEGVFAIAPGYQAVFGAQSARSTIDTASPPFAPRFKAGATLTSGYGQLSGEVLPNLTLTAGGRYDDHSTFGGHATGQASAAWRLNGGDTILRASFGQGFKAPSLFQLYSPFGNLTLRPEEANGWDAGIEQRFLAGRVDLQASYFGRETRNLIDFVSCFGITTGACAGNTVGGFYDNIARTSAQGVEVQATWRASDRLTLAGNYTYDHDVDRSPGSPTRGLQLARRPRNTANLTASYVWPVGLTTAVAVRYADRSYDNAANTIPLQSYVLWDLRASYPIGRRVALYGRIENLTDKHYETTYQYGTLGRAAYAGVRYQF
ncbi:MAG: TonB-dependent receptor [Caulobacteraceae bacterium]|nr:TonB-dependent receptor [Caulobacteraceae bacterium]